MKLVTFNLRHDADRWSERFPLVVDELYRLQPDVVGLQEVSLPIKQAHLIADALKRQGIAYEVLAEPKWGSDQEEGIAFLTRLEVLEHERLDLPEGNRVAQRIRVRQEGRVYDLVNTHL